MKSSRTTRQTYHSVASLPAFVAAAALFQASCGSSSGADTPSATAGRAGAAGNAGQPSAGAAGAAGASGATAGSAGSGARPPTKDEVPEMVAIAAPGMADVFVSPGQTKPPAPLTESYRMMKTQVTVKNYRTCVDVGACAYRFAKWASGGDTCDYSELTAWPTSGGGPWMDYATYELPNSDDLPMTCINHDEASQYCAWLGGRLPTVVEWLYAARGATKRQVAWGGTALTCNEGHAYSVSDVDKMCCKAPAPDQPPPCWKVGTHPANASPFGVLDMLVGPPNGEHVLEAVGAPTSKQVCQACSMVLADTVAPDAVTYRTEGRRDSLRAFRCVVPGDSQ